MGWKPDTQTLSIIITFIIQFSYGSLTLILFELTRNIKEVYSPKLRSNKERCPKFQLPKGFLAWVWPLLFKISEKEVLDIAGLDGYMFLRFLRLLSIAFFMMGTVAVCILLPIYGTAEHVDSLVVGINRYTMSNLGEGDSRLWISFISVYILTFSFLYLLHKEYENFTSLRQRFMINGDPDIPIQMLYSVMVEDIPKQFQSSKQLKLLFEDYFPDEVEDAIIGIDAQPILENICKKRTKNIEKLEKAIAVFESKDRLKMPTITMMDGGKKVDMGHCYRPCYGSNRFEDISAIQYYLTEAHAYNQQVAVLLKEAEKVDLMSNNKYTEDLYQYGITPSDWGQPLNNKGHFTLKSLTSTGFITFKTKRAVAIACQLAYIDDEYPDLKVSPAPIPTEIIWENMPVKREYTQFVSTFTNIGYYICLFFWGVIITFIQATSNLQNLKKYLPFVENLSQTQQALVQGQLPVWAMFLLMMIVPMVVENVSTKIERRKTISEVRNEVLNWYYYFQMANVFFSLLTGTAAGSTSAITDPLSTLNYLAVSLSSVSVFYINFLLTSLLSGVPMDLLRIFASISYLLCSRVYNERKLTIGQVKEALEDETVDYSGLMPDVFYVVLIVMIYWVIAPIVMLIGGFLFAAQYVKFRYKYCYVYVNDIETGGQYWYNMHRYSMQCLMASTSIFIAYMALKEAILQTTLLIPLPFVITYVWRYTNEKFYRISSNIAYRRAILSDLFVDPDKPSVDRISIKTISLKKSSKLKTIEENIDDLDKNNPGYSSLPVEELNLELIEKNRNSSHFNTIDNNSESKINDENYNNDMIIKENENNCYQTALLQEPILLEPDIYRVDHISLFNKNEGYCLNEEYYEPPKMSLEDIALRYTQEFTV